MSALQFFTEALERGEPQQWPANEADAASLNALFQAGLAVESRPVKLVTCQHCYEQHELKGTKASGYFTTCEEGRITIAPDELRRWRANASAVARHIRKQLGLAEALIELRTGSLWLLGRANSVNGGYPIWLLVGADAPSSREIAIETLETRAPAEAGEIIASSADAIATLWPRGTRALLLDEVMTVSSHGILLNRREISAHAPATRRNAAAPGRTPKNSGDPLAMFLDRIRSEKADKRTCKAEATALAGIEVSMFGEDDARKWNSIRNIISGAYAAWAAAGHPREFEWSHNPE